MGRERAAEMIVVDTSAYVAIFRGEPEADRLSVALGEDPRRVMSAGSYLEAGILAATRFGGRGKLDGWLRERRIDITPVDREQAEIAADAFERFGKGRHPAGLNYGDCFAYALARKLGAPLLFKGDDFARTDIQPALM